jgi:hypothetical protein
MKKLLLAAALLAGAGAFVAPADAATQSNCPPGQQGSAGDQTCAQGTYGGTTADSTSPSTTDTTGGATAVVPNAGTATGTGGKTDMGGGSSTRMGGATESTQ